MRARQGSVVRDRRSNVWNFFYWTDGKRHSKVLGKFRTKTEAWKAANALGDAVESQTKQRNPTATVKALIDNYRQEKMPQRIDTRRSYEIWLKNYILPQWSDCVITALQARPVELWIMSLDLA